MRIDQNGIRHVTADDPVTSAGNAHIASCPECWREFGTRRPRRQWGVILPLWIIAGVLLLVTSPLWFAFLRGLMFGR